MIGQILALALALALAVRLIEYLCSKKERVESMKHNLISILRNFSIISLLLYICFLIFVAPSKVNRISTSELSTMATDIQMVGGGRDVAMIPADKQIVWPSPEELSQAICKKVHHIKHVPSIKDF